MAVADAYGGVACEAGLDVPALLTHARGARTVQGFRADEMSSDDLLALDCDLLIPAALGDVINVTNADQVRARFVVEAANHPTTPAADEILTGRGIPVLPDILMNAGGVVGSYFEWTQNIQQYRWKEERFNDELRDVLVTAYRHVAQYVENHKVSHRQASYAIALDRVARAARVRGYV